jgi:hypothetical protein
VIELIIDKQILPAMQRAFPQPAGRAERALNNYVSTLRKMLVASLARGQTPMETKLNAFSLSLHALANQGGQIGKKKVRVHAWRKKNGWALVEPIEIGTNQTGMVSKVKFTDRVTLVWHEPEVNPDTTWVDGLEINNEFLTDTAKANSEIFNLLYPDYEVCVADGRMAEVFDGVDIDVASLKNYIIWLQEEARHFTETKRNHALFQARLVLAVAQHTGGNYYQRKIHSDFGRTYYSGTSVQNVNKELRHAMLGDCWEYDIRSSVVAWKLGYAQDYVAQHYPNKTVDYVFTLSTLYLRNKAALMANVKMPVFGKESDLAEALQEKMLKQAFTALSFGARVSGKAWVNRNGEWQNPSIADIFKRADERERFLADFLVCGFVQEQTMLDNYLYEGVAQHYPDLLKLLYLQTQSGRPSKSKVVAFLYQHEETAVMDIVRGTLAEHGKKVLANIRDAIVVRQRLSADLKHEIELRMQEQTANPNWRLGSEQVQRWHASAKEVKAREAAHRQRIAEEQALTAGYKNQWVKSCVDDDHDE